MTDHEKLIDAWLEWKRHNQGKAENTTIKYRGYLDRLVKFLAARARDLRSATLEDLEAFTGLHAHKEGLSPRSRRPLVACVRGFYDWLRRNGYVDADPARDLPYPLAGAKLPVGMGLQNAERLIMAPDINTFVGIRDAAMISILIGCGLRISGLTSLNESHLQFVQHEGVEWLIVRAVEKGGKERLVPAPHEARLLIRAYLGHPDLDQIDRTLPDGDRVLFVSVRNRLVTADKYFGEERRIAARSVYDRIVHYGRSAGIPTNELHPHALRHLYGTELAEEEVDLLRIQALLGHADPKTSQIYTKLAVRSLAKVVDKANPLRKMRTPVSDLVKQMSAVRGK